MNAAVKAGHDGAGRRPSYEKSFVADGRLNPATR